MNRTLPIPIASGFAAVACTLPNSAFAQMSGAGSLQSEDKIIVEGTRLGTSLDEAGSSVSIITADEIELKGYSFAIDAIASASGVTVNQNGPFGGVATVRIRGAGSDQTLVLLDGVPIGDPSGISGGYDFSVLDTSQIERIEVLKGAQSTLWGSDAIGGVINIISKAPDEGFGVNGFAEGGSFKTLRSGGAVSGRGDLGDFRLGVSASTLGGISKAEEDDGNNERDGYDGLTAAARGGLNLGHDIRLEALAHFIRGRTDLDGFSPPDFSLADSNDTSSSRQVLASTRLKVPLLQGRFQNELSASFTDIVRTGIFGAFESRNEGERLVFRYQGTFDVTDAARLAMGTEYEENKADGASTDINGLFVLAQVKPATGVTVSAGVRRDDHSDFGTATTGRATLAWAVTKALSLRASWGEGFKAPSIFQLTQSFGILPANGDLLPEESETFDVGADLSLMDGKANLSITYFDRSTTNQIIFAPNFRYENLDQTEANGVETDLSLDLGRGFNLNVAHSFINSRDTQTGEPQIRIPRHAGDVTLAYSPDGPFNGSVVVRYNGRETEGTFGTDVDSWTRVDLAASYRVSSGLEVYGRIENLLDADYQQISGYGTPGLSGYGGVRVAL